MGKIIHLNQAGASLLEAMVGVSIVSIALIVAAGVTKHRVAAAKAIESKDAGLALGRSLGDLIVHGNDKYMSIVPNPCKSDGAGTIGSKLSAFWTGYTGQNLRFEFIDPGTKGLPTPLDQVCNKGTAQSADATNASGMFYCLRVKTAGTSLASNPFSKYLAHGDVYAALYVGFWDHASGSGSAMTCGNFAAAQTRAVELFSAIYTRTGTSPMRVTSNITFGQVDFPVNRLVSALYRGVLGRRATESELTGWVDRFRTGATRSEIALGFLNSVEYRTSEVERFYQSIVGRSRDQVQATDGPDGFLDNANDPGPNSIYSIGERGVQAKIYASQTFWDQSGRDPTTFVANLYRKILGREPDANGLQDKLRILTGASASSATDSGARYIRENVAGNILDSLENRQNIVTTWYARYFGRSPDSAGLDHWTGLLDPLFKTQDGLIQTNFSWEAVQAYLLGSPEFYYQNET